MSEQPRLSTVDGGAIYRQLCAQCHGQLGQPPKEVAELLDPPPPDLTSEKYKYGDSFEKIKQSIRKGIGSNMILFKDRLTDEQIDAVTKYVLTLRKLSASKDHQR